MRRMGRSRIYSPVSLMRTLVHGIYRAFEHNDDHMNREAVDIEIDSAGVISVVDDGVWLFVSLGELEQVGVKAGDAGLRRVVPELNQVFVGKSMRFRAFTNKSKIDNLDMVGTVREVETDHGDAGLAFWVTDITVLDNAKNTRAISYLV